MEWGTDDALITNTDSNATVTYFINLEEWIFQQVLGLSTLKRDRISIFQEQCSDGKGALITFHPMTQPWTHRRVYQEQRTNVDNRRKSKVGLTGNVGLVELVQDEELELGRLGLLVSCHGRHLSLVLFQVSPGVSRCLLGMTCYRRHLSGRLLCFFWVWVSSRSGVLTSDGRHPSECPRSIFSWVSSGLAY